MELKPDIRMVIATLAGGGSERVCVRLANYWVGQGRKVELLLVRRQGVFLEALDARVLVRSAEVARTRYALYWLMKQLNHWSDVPTLIFGFDFGVGLGALKRLGLISSPLVYREGSCPIRNIPHSSHWKYRVFVAGMDGIVAQSAFALENLRRLGIRNVRATVIWNPLGRERCVVSPSAADRDSGGLHLLAAGRLSPEKGYLRLLDALCQIRSEHPSVRLTIAGEGPQRAALEARITKLGLDGVVRLTGFVPEMSPLFATTDVFVMSSFYEGQPNALLEALQYGCRVVAAGGGAGVGEVLAKLGLPECWVREEDFVAGLRAALRRTLSITSDRWNQARAELGRQTDIAAVGTAYLRFCGECR